MKCGAAFAFVFLLAACSPRGEAEEAHAAVERWRVKVLAEHPHDPSAFTQGLLFDGDTLLESTGQYGTSSVRRVEPETGAVLLSTPLDPGLFGEGLAKLGDRLYQLTWQAGLAVVYDAESLLPVDQRVYGGEGWGLTVHGDRLLMSDGSSRLVYRDPESFEITGTIEVTLDGKPLEKLNELEVVGEVVYANIWQEDWIARIDLASGRVTAVIDAAPLRPSAMRRRAGVLNGIAHDPRDGTFWLTGKYWPVMYQVTFEAVSP